MIFKTGDRVRLVETGNAAQPGATATVVGYDPDPWWGTRPGVSVKWDVDHPNWHQQCHGNYYAHSFELIKGPW